MSVQVCVSHQAVFKQMVCVSDEAEAGGEYSRVDLVKGEEMSCKVVFGGNNSRISMNSYRPGADFNSVSEPFI